MAGQRQVGKDGVATNGPVGVNAPPGVGVVTDAVVTGVAVEEGVVEVDVGSARLPQGWPQMLLKML